MSESFASHFAGLVWASDSELPAKAVRMLSLVKSASRIFQAAGIPFAPEEFVNEALATDVPILFGFDNLSLDTLLAASDAVQDESVEQARIEREAQAPATRLHVDRLFSGFSEAPVWAPPTLSQDEDFI